MNNSSPHRHAVFIANRGFALWRSRERIVRHLLDAGWRVSLVTQDDEYSRRLSELGAQLVPCRFERHGTRAASDIGAVLTIRRLFKTKPPDLVHAFNAKPVLFSNLCLLADKRTRLVSSITGLGQAFMTSRLLRLLAGTGYRLLLNRSDRVIFQNEDDRALFVSRGWVKPDRAVLIVSSGVDTEIFRPKPRSPGGPLRIGIMTRLLKSKGIPEFIEAARAMHKPGEIEFRIAGEAEQGHNDSIEQGMIEQAVSEGIIGFDGYQDDASAWFQGIDLFLFPTSYPEGVPRVVLEAAASGVPSMSYDVAGCRAAIIDEETGWLVPAGDRDALMERLKALCADRKLLDQAGRIARRHVEANFSILATTQAQLDLYRHLGITVA